MLDVEEKRMTVTQHQRAILQLLSQSNQMTIGELASLLGVSSVAATKNIHRLERKKLVKREVDKWDRRRTLLILTDAGSSILNQLPE